MKTFGFILLSLILYTLLIAFVFAVTVFVASVINNVGFYDQLCVWFGHGSAFANLFNK